VKLLPAVPFCTRIPHAGDERELWITDYPTALPDLVRPNETDPESQTSKGSAH
jgi:hypothetical protein